MKIRNGFVSNSSSSSFVVNGITRTEVEDILKDVYEIYVRASKLVNGNERVYETEDMWTIEEKKGEIVIDSTQDNSIPCFVQYFILDELKAEERRINEN